MAEKKKFIDVEVPILQKELQVLGTHKDLNNKTIKLDLSRKLRGKGVMITLQIFNDKDNHLIAAPKKIELLKSYIRRIIRKRTDNVEDSFSAQCVDVAVKIKPFLITRKKVSRVVRKNLRNTAREFLIAYVKEKEYNEVCEDILNGFIQKEMLPRLKKVYPLAFCDIRVFETKEMEKIDLSKLVYDEEPEIEEIAHNEEESDKEEDVEEGDSEEETNEEETDVEIAETKKEKKNARKK